MSIWDDINAGISSSGVLQAINPFVRDIVPGVAGIEDIFGIDPNTWGGGAAAGPTNVGAGGVYGGGSAGSGGATMDWSSMGVPAGLTLSGPRRIMPYSGGMIPSGFRVARRGARAPQAGRAAGVYLVPRRTMNPLNPKALLRAERRMAGFTHWVKRHFTIASHMPKRKKHHGGRFAKRRK